MSIAISQFITPPPPPLHFPPLVSIRLFSTSVSLFLPCKLVHLYHFSRFYIYALIYDVCFSLSDLLHSVWQSLDPSTSQQMTQFRSFLWLNNSPLYVEYILFICLSVDRRWFVLLFWLLWIMLLWTLVDKYLLESLFSILLGIHLGAELLGHMVVLYLTFWGTTQHFFHSSCTILHPPSQCACPHSLHSTRAYRW